MYTKCTRNIHKMFRIGYGFEIRYTKLIMDGYEFIFEYTKHENIATLQTSKLVH